MRTFSLLTFGTALVVFVGIFSAKASGQPISVGSGQQVFVVRNVDLKLPIHWGAPSKDLTLGVSSAPAFSQTQPVEIWLAVKNLSDTTKWIFRLGDLTDYDLTLVGPNRRIISPIPGSTAADFDGSVHPAISIPPQSSILYRAIDLRRHYQVTAKGTYSLAARSKVYLSLGDEQRGNVYTELAAPTITFKEN